MVTNCLYFLRAYDHYKIYIIVTLLSVIFISLGKLYLSFKNYKVQKFGLYLYAMGFAPLFGLGQKSVKKECGRIERYKEIPCSKCRHWTCCNFKKESYD